MAFSAVSDYVGSLVHPSVADDKVAFARHRAFIFSHLAGGLLAFAALPLILLVRGGQPTVVEIAVLVWLVVPILAALHLSRNAQIERAHFISTASFALLILTIASLTGGIGSFALVWLPVIAFEAALSGSRRVILASLGTALFVVLALLVTQAAGASNSVSAGLLPEIGAAAAVIYAAALALRSDSLQRTIADSRLSHESRYELIASHSTELITRHTANGAVIFASPAATRLLGTGASDLQGRGLFERVHVADRPAYLTALSKAARGEENTATFRVRTTAAADSYNAPPQYIWVQMICSPGGTDGHVTAVTRETRAHEDQYGSVEETEPRAGRADIASGRFLASMSHELRTPLNAIIGFSELLASNQISDEKRRHEYAGLIHESGLHLLSVVNGILDMSRIDSGNFAIVAEPFQIKPVVDGCLQLFALKAADASVSLACDVDDDIPDVLADKRACRQILINLVSNAIKFTPAGGSVTVSASEDGDMIRIDVSDTGVGIAPEHIPNLGTSFFQAGSSYDRPYEGTGLGLSVVKGLVKLHHGSFDVASELGRGTCISVRLPKDVRHAACDEPAVPEFREPRTATG